MSSLQINDITRNNLRILDSLPPEVIGEFGRISVRFLRYGGVISERQYESAAQKLGRDPEDVENCVKALAYVFTQSVGRELSSEQFRASLSDIPGEYFGIMVVPL